MEQQLAMKISIAALLLSCFGVLGTGAVSSEGNVVVDFYSESLCPYCANFVVNYLSKMVKDDLLDIMDLRIIPYGNAQIYADGEIICQHGEDECKLNVIQTCGVKLYPNVTEWFPFILCLETLVADLPRAEVFTQWKTCVEPSGLSLEPIEECFEGPLGDKYEREYAAETASLIPPHRYVPWVVVNGTPLYDDYVYVQRIVCQAYSGPKALPSACEKYGQAANTVIESAINKAESASGVCERY